MGKFLLAATNTKNLVARGCGSRGAFVVLVAPAPAVLFQQYDHHDGGNIYYSTS